MEDPINNNPVWQFSVNLYKNDPVKYACLYLQNTQDININVLLFLLWCAKTTRGAVSEKQLGQIGERLEFWHQKITMPLRKLRTKDILQVEQFRKVRRAVLGVELFSDQLEQAILYEYGYTLQKNFYESRQQLSDAVKSLKAFSHYYKFTWQQISQQQLVTLLNYIFDDIEEPFINQVVEAYLIRKTPSVKPRLEDRQHLNAGREIDVSINEQ